MTTSITRGRKARSLLMLTSASAVAALTFTACGSESAEEYPSDTIEMIVPYSAGGSTDLTMRRLGDIAEETCGTGFIVSNQTGAAGTVGVSAALNGTPDGYTISATAADLILPHQLGIADISMDDARGVLRYALNDRAVFVPADSPYESIDEIFEAAESGTTITVATPGSGSEAHLSGVGIAQEYGLTDQFNFLPFDGDATALQAVAGNQADMTLISIGTGVSQVEGGLVNAIATLSEERSDVLPDTPTAIESGIDWAVPAPLGIVIAAETPDEIVEKLNSCLGEAVESDEFRETMETQNLNIDYLPGDEFEEYMLELEAFYGDIIEEADLATE